MTGKVFVWLFGLSVASPLVNAQTLKLAPQTVLWANLPSPVVRGFQIVPGSEIIWVWSDRNLWRSRNSGKTWQEEALPPVADRTSGSVSGPGDGSFPVAGRGWFFRSRYLFVRGGVDEQWKRLRHPLDSADAELDAVAVDPLGNGCVAGGVFTKARQGEGAPNNASRANPAGRIEILRAALYCTADQGATWRRESLPPMHSGHRVTDILRLDSGSPVLTDESFLYKNAGIWRIPAFSPKCVSPSFLAASNRIPAAAAVFLRHGWVSWDDGRLARSFDYGAGWCEVQSAETQSRESRPYFVSIAFLSDSHGIALNDRGLAYISTDGGTVWGALDSDKTFQAIGAANGRLWAVQDSKLLRVSQ